MIGYTACEQALLTAIKSAYPEKLNDTNCVAGKLDDLLKYMFENRAKYGCYTDFAGGTHKKPEVFGAYVWQWDVNINLLMRIEMSTVECDIRELIDLATDIFSKDFDFRLGNQVAKAEVTVIGVPFAQTIADTPFYQLTLRAYIWDKEQ